MILAAGEALIDLVMASDAGAVKFTAHVGGAPLNAAIALGRLDVPVSFACPVSGDAFGDIIRQKLAASNVRLAAPDPVAAASPLAVVTLDDQGVPAYQFYREGTADRKIDDDFIAHCLAIDFSLIHIGGTCLANPVDFDKWMALVDAARNKGALVSLDPNIRPSLIDDFEEFIHRMKYAFASADLIKASDEDCQTLFGHADLETLSQGPFAAAQLVLLSRGSAGASARLADGTVIDVPTKPLESLRDTVGAGDCFQAGLLSHLWRAGSLNSLSGLKDVTPAVVEQAIIVGHAAAAINCARDGCNPAWRSEMPTG